MEVVRHGVALHYDPKEVQLEPLRSPGLTADHPCGRGFNRLKASACKATFLG